MARRTISYKRCGGQCTADHPHVASCMQRFKSLRLGVGNSVLLVVEARFAVGCLHTSGMASRRHAGAFALVAVVVVASLSQGAALSDRDAHLAHQTAAKVCSVCSLNACH